MITQKTKDLLWLYSKDSDINILGKIILSPLVLFLFIIWATLDVLFLKRSTK